MLYLKSCLAVKHFLCPLVQQLSCYLSLCPNLNLKGTGCIVIKCLVSTQKLTPSKNVHNIMTNGILTLSAPDNCFCWTVVNKGLLSQSWGYVVFDQNVGTRVDSVVNSANSACCTRGLANYHSCCGYDLVWFSYWVELLSINKNNHINSIQLALIPFYCILLYCTLFISIVFQSSLAQPILVYLFFYSIILCSALHCFTLLYSSQFYLVLFNSIRFYSIQCAAATC